jgi:hypothetical protein
VGQVLEANQSFLFYCLTCGCITPISASNLPLPYLLSSPLGVFSEGYLGQKIQDDLISRSASVCFLLLLLNTREWVIYQDERCYLAQGSGGRKSQEHLMRALCYMLTWQRASHGEMEQMSQLRSLFLFFEATTPIMGASSNPKGPISKHHEQVSST